MKIIGRESRWKRRIDHKRGIRGSIFAKENTTRVGESLAKFSRCSLVIQYHMIKENFKPIKKKNRKKSNQSVPLKIGIKNEETNRNKFESLNKSTIKRYKNQPSQKVNSRIKVFVTAPESKLDLFNYIDSNYAEERVRRRMGD